MTEERIKELIETYPITEQELITLIRTVAAEAREDGIDGAIKIALPCLIESENIKKAFTLEIERLKKKDGNPDCPEADAFPYELWNHLWAHS